MLTFVTHKHVTFVSCSHFLLINFNWNFLCVQHYNISCWPTQWQLREYELRKAVILSVNNGPSTKIYRINQIPWFFAYVHRRAISFLSSESNSLITELWECEGLPEEIGHVRPHKAENVFIGLFKNIYRWTLSFCEGSLKLYWFRKTYRRLTFTVLRYFWRWV